MVKDSLENLDENKRESLIITNKFDELGNFERRYKKDRRVSRKSYKGKNKRYKLRRKQDKRNIVSYNICYSVTLYGLIFWAFLIIYFKVKGW